MEGGGTEIEAERNAAALEGKDTGTGTAEQGSEADKFLVARDWRLVSSNLGCTLCSVAPHRSSPPLPATATHST